MPAVTCHPFRSALLLVVLSCVCGGGGAQGPGQDRRLVYRRGEVSGLFPFPRVGRSHIPSEDLFGQKSFAAAGVAKRQGLIPFPRVGKRHPVLPPMDYTAGTAARSLGEEAAPWQGAALSERKRTMAGGQGSVEEGMWFGPRLGRRRRRSAVPGEVGRMGPKPLRPLRPRAAHWLDDDNDAGSPRELLERLPDLKSILRSKEVHSEEDEVLLQEEDEPEMYGEVAEPSGVGDGEVYEEESLSGRRRRRQPVDSGTNLRKQGASGDTPKE